MSNPLAIACVTRALGNRLNQLTLADFSGLPLEARPTHQVSVTTLPLNRVRKDSDNTNQLNLFLYQVGESPAWRNRNLPQAPPSADLTAAPLAIELRYILTVYAQDDNDLIAHVLFGEALQILHANPLFSREELADALALSQLDQQIERVRVTPESLSLEETSRLWTGFQSDFRLSAAYKVSVLLIDSDKPQRFPLPVLKIGSDNRGANVFPISAPSLDAVREIFDPSLLPLKPSPAKPAAELGDQLVLAGASLSNEGVAVEFAHPLLPSPLEIAPLPSALSTELNVRIPGPSELPSAPSTWPIGIYFVALRVARPSLPPFKTNQLAFALAPTLTALTPKTRPLADVPFDLTVQCVPQIRDKQQVTLLFGDRELHPDSITTPPSASSASSLVFHVPLLPAGTYVVRLRVDGVTSLPVDFTATTPSFDPDQLVTITP